MPIATLFYAILFNPVPVVIKPKEIPQNKIKKGNINNHKTKHQQIFLPTNAEKNMVSLTYRDLLYRGFDQFLIMQAEDMNTVYTFEK